MDAGSVLQAAAADAAAARWNFHELRRPFSATTAREVRLLADVWAFDARGQAVLLVDHPKRGWVMPGGKVEPGETARAAAVREFDEETGVTLDPSSLRCVAITGRLVDDVLAIGLSYAAWVDDRLPLHAEPGQPARWWSLDEEWRSIYPHDRRRLRMCAASMTAAPTDLRGMANQ